MLLLLALAHAVAGSPCPGYTEYSQEQHAPLSLGPLQLSYARPLVHCRRFNSSSIESTVKDVSRSLQNPDVARLFENCFPNTLDTAISWYTEDDKDEKIYSVSGAVNVFWLRESAQKLHPYRDHIVKDPAIAALFKEAITSQIEYILDINPNCNSFNPPEDADAAGLTSTTTEYSEIESAIPIFGPRNSIFECKYALDTLASFFRVSADYFEASQDPLFFADNKWLNATRVILALIKNEAKPPFAYRRGIEMESDSWQKTNITDSGDGKQIETAGKQSGNGLLIRSFFRPSDEAQAFQYHIPSNAYMAMMLARVSDIASSIVGGKQVTAQIKDMTDSIRTGIEENAIVHVPEFGQVYAYEIDGYGGQSIMDDATYPNLLGLPLMNYTDTSNQVYQNTRRLILSRRGNPYFYVGKKTEGIGSSRTGLNRAWPLSSLIAIQTSKNTSEIIDLLELVGNSTSGLGLMHESVYVDDTSVFTKSWYSQANGEFGAAILDVIQRFPGLIDRPHSKETIAAGDPSTEIHNHRNISDAISGGLPE